MTPVLRLLALLSLLLGQSLAAAAPRACLSECTPRIGIVSAFGEEAAILVRETRAARTWTINGNRSPPAPCAATASSSSSAASA